MATITEGTHQVVVVDTALGESGAKKTPHVAIQFEGEMGDRISAYLFLSDAAWPYTKEKLSTLGWDADVRGHRFEELNESPSPLAGQKAEIVVVVENYDGKVRHKVQYINTPGSGVERMEPAAARTFADTLRKRLLSGGKAKAQEQERFGAEMEALEASVPPPHDDSDVPF